MNQRDMNFLRERLTEFLPKGDEITGLSPLTAGHSNETYVIEGLDRILRMASAASSFESHGVLTQARIYDEVSRLEGAPPVPRIQVIHEDPQLLGSPFFVMEKVEGVSIDDYTLPQWFTSLPDAGRGKLCGNWIAAISSIATLPPVAALGTPRSPEDEIRHWRQIAAGENAIELVTLFDRLLAIPPPRSGDFSVVHGDCKINNMLFVDGRISAVLDWEFAYNGDPLSDLGYLLYFFASEFHGPTRPTRLSGMWTREQVITAWEQASGRSAAEVAWHEAAQITRLSAMIVTAANLFAAGQSDDKRFELFGAKVKENIVTAQAMLKKLEAA
jgi:aminoglycoside phosphotransferase (APT) family kinase protein